MAQLINQNKIVTVESPYAGDTARNIKYAQECIADCFKRGEAPFASHLLYTQPNILDDSKPEERKLGIETGFVFKHITNSCTVFYIDLGWSDGMQKALNYCKEYNLAFEFRSLKSEESLIKKL